MKRSVNMQFSQVTAEFQGKKEHFQGLLSEILKENSKCKKNSQIPLKFSGPEVEKRSLDVYEIFSQGGFE